MAYKALLKLTKWLKNADIFRSWQVMRKEMIKFVV